MGVRQPSPPQVQRLAMLAKKQVKPTLPPLRATETESEARR